MKSKATKKVNVKKMLDTMEKKAGVKEAPVMKSEPKRGMKKVAKKMMKKNGK